MVFTLCIVIVINLIIEKVYMYKFARKVSIILALIFGIQSATPRQAHAIAAATGVGSLVVLVSIGGASLLGAPVLTGTGLLLGLTGRSNDSSVRFYITLGAVLFLAGFALLPEDPSNFSIEFLPVDLNKSTLTHLTQKQIQSYNAELTQINLAAQEINAYVNSGDIKNIDQAHAAWLSYRDQGLISENAFKVLQQISAENARRLTKASR